MPKLELKLKIKVEDLLEVRERVRQTAKFIEKTNFIDTFFSKSDKKIYQLRVRSTKTRRVTSLKLFLKSNKVQKNAIYDFEANPNDFIEFLETIGFKPCLLLRKVSEIYQYKEVTIELTQIERMGNFAELIILSDEKREKEDEKKLFELSKLLGLDKKTEDLRYYTEIAKECNY